MVAIPGETISHEKVVIRTRSAGVFHGTISALEDGVAHVTDVRRIWRWRGANTLNEVVQYGIEHSDKGYSRVSEPLRYAYLLEVIEVLPCSKQATESIEKCGWAK